MKVLFVFSALLSIAMAIENYGPCEVGGTRPHTLIIHGCDVAPCDIREGEIIRIETIFEAGKLSSTSQ